jgi:hypothetical protein
MHGVLGKLASLARNDGSVIGSERPITVAELKIDRMKFRLDSRDSGRSRIAKDRDFS